ncbi:hypothetical protein FI667_g8918, partial [Globisporangium splendens]
MEKTQQPELPDGAASACHRPAAPFALSMMLDESKGGAGGECGKFVLPKVALRKVAPKPLFDIAHSSLHLCACAWYMQNFDGSAYLIKPPTQMLRFVDALRYHKPTEDERSEWNISSSTERLCLHVLNDILLICGARRGFRFNSQDINSFRALSEKLETQFALLDQTFRTLPFEVTKYKFADLKRIEDDTQFFQLACKSKCPSVEIPSHLRFQEEEAVRWRAMQFQWHAREYVVTFSKLRETILCVRERLKHYMDSRKITIDSTDLGDAGNTLGHSCVALLEAEFEAKVHQPFPAFLFVLIQKYHREYREEETPWTPESTEPPVDSIAQFSLYLSGILVQRAPLTVLELRSMEVMLQVLKISYDVDYELLTIELVGVWRGNAPHSHHSNNCGQAHRHNQPSVPGGALTHSILSSLLYDFLATVRELRLVPRQKELMQPHTNPRRARRAHSKENGAAASGQQQQQQCSSSSFR